MKLIKDTAVSMLDRLLRLVIGVVVTVVLARYLGVEDYGILAYYLSLIALTNCIVQLGLPKITVRLVASSIGMPVHLAKVVGGTLLLKLFAAVWVYLAVLALWGAGLLATNDYTLLMAVAVFLLPFDVFDSYLQGVKKFGVLFSVKIGALLVSASVKLMGVVLSAELSWFLYAALFDFALVFITFVSLRIAAVVPASMPDKKIVKQILSAETGAEFFAGIAALSILKLDQIMLEKFEGVGAVGTYAVAAKLTEVWVYFPVAILAAAFPVLVRCSKEDPTIFSDLVRVLYVVLFYASVIVCLIYTVLGNVLISNAFGEAYQASASILAIYSWSSLLIVLGIVSGSVMVIEGKAKKNMLRNILAAAINFMLNLVFIPRFGAEGAAIATVISLLFCYYLYDLMDQSLRVSFFQKSSLLNPIYVVGTFKLAASYVKR